MITDPTLTTTQPDSLPVFTPTPATPQAPTPSPAPAALPNDDDLLPLVGQSFDNAALNQRAILREAIQQKNATYRNSGLERIADVPLSILRGGVGASASIIRAVDDTVGSLTGRKMFSEDDWADLAALNQPHTFIGGLAKGLSQYAFTAYLLRGAAPALMARTGFLAKTAQFAATDALAFDGQEGRFADTLAQVPFLRKMGIGVLASDPDDSWVTKRAKNVVEGFLLNHLTHGAAKLGGSAFAGVFDKLRGGAGDDLESILKNANPEALKEITENPEAQRLTGEITAANPNYTPEQVQAVLLGFRNMAARYGHDLTEVLKRVKFRGDTVEDLQARQQIPDLFQGERGYFSEGQLPPEPTPADLTEGGTNPTARRLAQQDAEMTAEQEAATLRQPQRAEMEDGSRAAFGEEPYEVPPEETPEEGSLEDAIKPPPTDEPTPVDPRTAGNGPNGGELGEPRETPAAPESPDAAVARTVKPDARGAVAFYGDHQAVVYLFQNADFSTLAHESWHVFRKWWVNGADLDTLTKEFAPNGWDAAADERAAAAFERYLRDGQAPKGSPLAGLMAKFRGWMTQVYQNITGTPLQADVKPEVRNVFDKILAGEKQAAGEVPSPTATPADGLTAPQVLSQSGTVQTPTLADELPPDHLDQIKQATRAIISTGAPPEEVMRRTVQAAINFNGPRTGLQGNALANLEAGYRIMADELKDARGGTEALDTLANRYHAYASTIADNPDRMARFLDQFSNDADTLSAVKGRMTMAREMYTSLMNEVSQFSAKFLNANEADQAAIGDDIAWRLEQAWQLQRYDKAVSVEMARGLGARRIVPQADLDVSRAAEWFRRRLAGAGDSTEVQRIVRDLANGGTDEVNAATLTTQLLNKFSAPVLNALVEYRRNALISGLSSPLAKALADTAQTTVRPAERLLGGRIMQGIASVTPEGSTLNQWAQGGLRAARVGQQEYAYMMEMVNSLWDQAARVEGVFTPWEAGWKAGLEETHFLSGTHEPMRAISADALNLNPEEAIGKAADVIGNVVRIPQRTMQGVTELFQQIKYQSLVKAKAAVDALDQGITDPEELTAFVNGKLRTAYDELGQGTDKEALLEAQQVTAADPLGGFSQKIQSALMDHPLAQLVLPFFKTPLNLLKQGVQYTPGLNLLESSYRNMLFGGNANLRAVATGKLAVGAAFWTSVLGAAFAGHITGEGPSDPKLRETMTTAGWRPHSLVFDGDGGKTYVDYRKLEPLANVLSIAGDFAETVHLMKDEDVTDLAKAMTMSIAKNLVSKTYLSGLADFIDTLRRPDYSMARFMGNFAGSFVPRLVGNVDPDGELREVRGFLDGIKARLPGYSATLPPVRNALGEPVLKSEPSWSPIRWATTPDDAVGQELSQYNHGLPSSPRRIAGLDLSQFTNEQGQDAHDRLQELVGQTQIKGKTLRDTLTQLFGSQWYAQQPPATDPSDITNPRVQAVQRAFLAYHTAARAQLSKEYPQIQAMIQAMGEGRAKAGSFNLQTAMQPQ